MENVPDFEQLFASSRKTTEEVQQILNEYLDSEDVVGDVSKPPANGSEVDRAFGELLS